MGSKSKILIMGGTGHVGKFIVEASVRLGHPTFALIRESAVSDPKKAALIESFKSLGVTFLYGDLYNHQSLVDAIKQVDIVISIVGGSLEVMDDQVKIIAAIKEAGNIKRFLPAEFEIDVDRMHAVEPSASYLMSKVKIRRAVEAEEIPHTYLVSNGLIGFLPHYFNIFEDLSPTTLPRDKVVVLGDGNTKVVFNKEEDVATYTIKAADDPRTLNKIVYIKPPANILSFNEIISLWEKKIGKTVERIYIPEEELLKKIEEAPTPLDLFLSIGYSAFVKGDSVNFKIEASFGAEATELYPDVKYTTVDEFLDQFV